MPRARSDRTAATAFDALTVEGALISPAMLARIAQRQAEGQNEADYGVPKGLSCATRSRAISVSVRPSSKS
jgi:hypothetical protein